VTWLYTKGNILQHIPQPVNVGCGQIAVAVITSNTLEEVTTMHKCPTCCSEDKKERWCVCPGHATGPMLPPGFFRDIPPACDECRDTWHGVTTDAIQRGGMIYISKGNSKGALRPGEPTEIELHKQPKPLMRSICMILLDRGTYTTTKLTDVVWKHAGFLCVEVVFNHDFKMKDGSLSHTYDLYFQTGRFGTMAVDNDTINQIMCFIEQDLEASGEFDLRGSTHKKVCDDLH